jgi:hypothetical protein
VDLRTVLKISVALAALAVPARASASGGCVASPQAFSLPAGAVPGDVFSELCTLDCSEPAAPAAGFGQGGIESATNSSGLASIVGKTGNATPAEPAHEAGLMRLAAPPAALLMLLQGVLCIAIVRGRRKWAFLAVAAISLGRAGLNALPRLFDGGTSSGARTVATQPDEPEYLRLARQAYPSVIPDSFASLEPPVDTIAASLHAQCDLVPRERRSSFPTQPLLLPLFARPPPFISA